MYQCRKSIVFFASLLCATCLLVPLKLFAFGVSPTHLFVTDITARNSIEQRVLITKEPDKKPLDVNVSMSGTGTSAVHLKTTRIHFTAEQTSYTFSLNVEPNSLPVGNYAVSLLFAPVVSSTPNPTSLKVSLGTKLEFSVVSEDIKKIEVSDLSLTKTNDGKALLIGYTLSNTGNTTVLFDHIRLAISNTKASASTVHKDVEIVPAVAIKPKTKYQQTQKIEFSAPISEYNMNVSFLSGKELLGAGSKKIVTGLLQPEIVKNRIITPFVISLCVALGILSIITYFFIKKNNLK